MVDQVQKTVLQPEKSSFFGKTGGTYIPPAKLRQMQQQITDKTSEDYQRLTWEALKKSLNGLINKVNVSNIKEIIPEIFSENLIRGRGLLCRSLMKAQAASQPFTPVFAAVVAVINTKFPMIGELLIMRLLAQFRRAYKRSDKAACLSSTNFIAHLVNHKVANEIVALQILTLLLERPTDDSVEVAVGYMRQVGAFLMSESPKACNAVFERFRGILHEGSIDKRTQYMVEVLFQIRKDKFSEHIAIKEELDIVEEEDQITHLIGLTDELDTQDSLNVFKYDPEFLENEQKYEYMKREILGDESDEDSEEEDSSEEDEEVLEAKRQMQIQDHTNTNLVNLRRAIYLTIMSSLNFEECAHKLLKLDIPSGQEIELCNMVIECCSQEKTYVNFYGLLGERFCRISPEWANAFTAAFEETYKTIHRYETNRLRNIAKFYSHILATDALSWELFALIRLTEQDTTSSSRIFCKIMFTELVEAMGLKKLGERFSDKDMVVTVETPGGMVTRGTFDGLFPKDNPKNTRFAINYFTSIGLGALTEGLREHLKNLAAQVDSSSESDSSDSSDSDSESLDSNSDSEDDSPPRRKRRESPERSPVKRRESPEKSPVRRRERSPERSSRRYGESPSRKDPPKRDRSAERGRGERDPRDYEKRSVRRASPRRAESPKRKRDYSPRQRDYSPRRNYSPKRRDESPRRDNSPRRRGDSPYRRRNDERKRSRSPRRDVRGSSDRRSSPAKRNSYRKRSRSPRRSRSPERRRSPPKEDKEFVHPSRKALIPK
ncbi:pre-mRNA-splicing factor cwc22 [Boothiomyces macroporosus]|uniref:Pre-mRNA-splicing factor cwc22 n=1 Tax=Boothiomyces macroporosus TaxID=261099 RepID=A0AAD5U938_9FUNG|nr:pre-mRNA-splicing factor cwc22 [Boothiomyces macroporosus]